MQHICANSLCKQSFEVTPDDLAFYEKVSPVFNGKKELIPPPTLCPECRMQRRMPWRNEMHVFLGVSSFSGKKMMTQFAPSSPYTVYTTEEHASDAWNPLSFGIDYHSDSPFFEIFDAQLRRIPLASRAVIGNENCDYANSTSWSKNCYMVGASTRNEDCYYCYNLGESKNCMDCNFIFSCERCYECTHCRGSHALRYSNKCIDCHESYFLKNCQHCSHCFGCANLVRKEYCILNQQYSKDEYNARLKLLTLSSSKYVQKVRHLAQEHWRQYPCKYILGEMNDPVTGNNIFESKNAINCFDASKLHDCKNCWTFHQAKDCMDCFGWGRTAELCYDCTEVGDGATRVLCSAKIYHSHDVLYSFSCQSSHHLFGCVSLKNASYCIFNSQYSSEEYERIVPLLIHRMREHGEWGEFFPLSIAPFAYNASAAIDYFPVDRMQAEKLGARWYEEKQKYNDAELFLAPDTVSEIVGPSVFRCAVTGVPYKIVEQELDFYRSEGLPPAHECFVERTKRRFVESDPHHLWSRFCAQCSEKIETTYAPDRPETVICEECYLKTVY